MTLARLTPSWLLTNGVFAHCHLAASKKHPASCGSHKSSRATLFCGWSLHGDARNFGGRESLERWARRIGRSEIAKLTETSTSLTQQRLHLPRFEVGDFGGLLKACSHPAAGPSTKTRSHSQQSSVSFCEACAKAQRWIRTCGGSREYGDKSPPVRLQPAHQHSESARKTLGVMLREHLQSLSFAMRVLQVYLALQAP